MNSRLNRSQFLQVKTPVKALAEIYTIYSYSPFGMESNPFSNPNFFRQWSWIIRAGLILSKKRECVASVCQNNHKNYTVAIQLQFRTYSSSSDHQYSLSALLFHKPTSLSLSRPLSGTCTRFPSTPRCRHSRRSSSERPPRRPRPELKGSVGERPNQTNYSDRSSVRILGI